MTISYSKISKSLRAAARAGSISVLSAAMILLPVPGMMSEAWAVGEAQALSQAGTLAGAGSQAAKAISSMTGMQAANSMLDGKKQMQCCKEGCDGAGKQATANKAGQDAAAKGAADSLPKFNGGGNTPAPSPPPQPKIQEAGHLGPIGKNFHLPRSDESLALLCTSAGPQAKMIYDLLHPQKVEAMAGCNDAMMAMAQGAMQMLSALAGLAAGMMGGANSNAANTSAANMAEIPAAAAVNPVGATGLNSGTGNTSPIQIDPALLRDGKGAAIAAEFEKNFGIPAESFANGLLNGADPRAMLMSAPKNAFTADELNQAFSAAKSMSADQKAAALAGLSDLQKDMLAKVDQAAEGTEMTAGSKSASRSPSSSSGELDDLSDLMGANQAAAPAPGVNTSELSPELQAALAARDTAEARDNSTIFQVVHAKYQEKIRMIYGFDAHGHSIGGKGVANADGY